MLPLMLAATPSWAKDLAIPLVTYPKLAVHAASGAGFVPKGWRLQSQVRGDLNKDGLADLAIVLTDADAKNILDNRGNFGPERFDTNPHILAVAFARKDGGYDLALENHTLAARPIYPNAQDALDPNGEQPGGIEIKNGLLKVTLGHFSSAGGWGMGRATYSFRYGAKAFVLIGYDSIEVSRNTGDADETSVDYLSGRMKLTASNVSDDGPGKVTWKRLPARPPLTIDRIGDGIEFDPKT